MKKTLVTILVFCMIFSVLVPMSPVGAESLAEGNGNVYYVSPLGSDNNPGTAALPWKTLHHVAQTLVAGDTAIFEDGFYEETQITQIANSGSADNPITIKARNPHRAVICYDEALRLKKKLCIRDKSYINIRNFTITQESRAEEYDAAPTLDILVDLNHASYCEVTGNKMTYAYEEGLKVTASNHILAADNIVSDMIHEGFDIFSTADSIIRGNQIIDCGRVGFMVKGNSRNCLVYNNYVYNSSVQMTDSAFTIGGSSDNTSPYIIAENEGFENYNSVFYNNLVYSKTRGLIKYGFSFLGAKNGHCYNNVVVGTTYGIAFRIPNNMVKGWPWNPTNVNPVLYNNIIADANYAYLYGNSTVPENLVSDYNLFYNITQSSSIPSETNSIYANPRFIADGANFRLADNSPAREAGITIPSSVAGFAGIEGVDEVDTNKTVAIDLVDFSGAARQTPWDMGIYNRGQDETIVNLMPQEMYTLPETITWENAPTDGVVDTSVTGTQIYTGADADGNAVTYRVNVGGYETLVYEDMESYDVGATSISPTEEECLSILGATNVGIAYETGTSGNKVFSCPANALMAWPTASSFTGLVLPEAYRGSFRLSGKLKFGASGDAGTTGSIFIIPCASDFSTAYKNNTLGGAFFYTNSNTQTRLKYTAGNAGAGSYIYFNQNREEWTEFEMVFNYSTETYDIIINGAELVSDQPYDHVKDLKSVMIVSRSTKLDISIDDLKIEKYVTVADNLADKSVTCGVVVGASTAQTTTVPLLMSDDTMRDFTVNYTVDTSTPGTDTVAGTVAGFTQTVPVTVTVAAESVNETINVTPGSRCILSDGTRVDTSSTGTKYYTVITDAAIIHYTVNIRELTQIECNGMDYTVGTVTTNLQNDADGSYVAVASADRTSGAVQIVEEEGNKVLSLGPTATNYTTKTVFNEPVSGLQKISTKLKFNNITELTSSANIIPYHVRVFGANGNILSWMYFRFYFTTNGFSKVTARAMVGEGLSPSNEVVLNDVMTFTDGVGTSDWITLELIYNTDGTYDMKVGDTYVVSGHNIYTGTTGSATSSLPVTGISLRRVSVANDTTSYAYMDDVALYAYSNE